MGCGSGMGGSMFFGLLMVVGLILLVWLLIWAIGGGVQRRGSGGSGKSNGVLDGAEPSARRLLDERFARGEIDTDEYQERLRVLGGRD